MSRYYDRAGRPVTLEAWIQLASRGGDYRRVDHTDITPGVFVSTVWVGWDSIGREVAPLIFETMAFTDRPLVIAGEAFPAGWVFLARYATEVDAIDGHTRFVAQVADSMNR